MILHKVSSIVGKQNPGKVNVKKSQRVQTSLFNHVFFISDPPITEDDELLGGIVPKGPVVVCGGFGAEVSTEDARNDSWHYQMQVGLEGDVLIVDKGLGQAHQVN